MALASLFGGLALSNAGLGAVHGFAGAIGGMFHAPHGAICAALLPQVMEGNLRALRQREPRHDALRRYEEIGRILTGEATASADDGVEWVRRLVGDLRIPTLGSYGLVQADMAEIIEKGSKAGSMKANPIVLTNEEQREILGQAL
jgi:alcohol dehydrogenase class IV